jgi:hypothetical protein
MHRFTHHAFIALATAVAFLSGAAGGAVAGDPDEAAEAPPPGPAPAIAIWDTEVREVAADGLRFTLEDSSLSIVMDQGGEKPFAYEVRCELAQGSPFARMYMPPIVVSEQHVEGRLATSERMVVPLDVTPRGETDSGDGPPVVPAAMFDTLRVSIRPVGVASDAPALAVLQIPRA